MSYAKKFLKANGESCTIVRTPAVSSYVSMKHATRAARDFGMKEGFFEGLMDSDSNLLSGDVFTAGPNSFLVFSVRADPQSQETEWFGAKVNTSLGHKRKSGATDASFNITYTWANADASYPTIAAFMEIVTYRMRQFEAGLLDSTLYIAMVQKARGAKIGDRMVHNDKNLEVVSIDDAALPGIVRLQLARDTRQ
jgi:hypothetical protein